MKRADELSFEIARAALERVSPQEIPIVDALGLDFVESASAPTGGDGALGFDVEQVTYAVAASSCAVLVKDYLVELAKSTAKELASEQGPNLVKAMVSKLKDRRGAAKAVKTPVSVRLDPAELAEVRKRAYLHAKKIGLAEAKASLVADAIAGSLALDH